MKNQFADSINVNFKKWVVLDSNQRPPPCQGGALNQLS